MKEFVPYFPHLLAFFNVSTVVLLLLGFAAIRHENRQNHQRCMMAALGVAVLFLIIYVLYHLEVGNVAFAGEGNVRWLYFSLLIAHILSAAIILIMVPMTLIRALRNNFAAHKSLARKSLPLWLFVSVSGFVVYLMAFHIWPA